MKFYKNKQAEMQYSLRDLKMLPAAKFVQTFQKTFGAVSKINNPR